MWRKLAKAVSTLLHPYLVPLYIVLIILGTDSTFALFPPRLKLYMFWVSALYTAILPFITCSVLHFIGRNKRYAFLRRQARITGLLVSACCFLLGSINFMRGGTSLGLFYEITTTGFCCALFMLLLIKWWRASAHLTSAGAAIIFLVMMNLVGRSSHLTTLLVAILLTGILTSSRLYLGRCDIRQAMCSIAVGIFACLISLILL